ncbi:MAG: outer membrane lipoprotein chaperone LolA [Gemmatimonadaceae bacterium]
MKTMLSAAAALVLALPLSAQTPEQTIDRATKAYAKVKTARASFEQTLTNPLTGNTQTARGEYQQAPNRLAVTFTQPRGDRVVNDGKAVWVYLPSSAPNQVIKLAPAAGAAGGVDLLGTFLTSPRTKYTMSDAGTAVLAGRRTHAVTLVPRAPMQFTKATVWIDDADATLRQFEVTDNMGLQRKVRITKLALNGPVDRSAFAFTPPRGVKVYDQRAMAGGQ